MTVAVLASTALLSACGLSAAAAVAGLFANRRAMRRVHHAAMIASALAGALGSGVFLAWRMAPISLGASAMLFGAPLSVDRLSSFFLLLLHLVAAMAAWFGSRYTEEERAHYPLRAVLPLTAVFVLSMQGVLLSSGVAAFLLFWEAMSLAAFLLVMADGEEESRKAALLYLAVAQFGAGALMVGSGMAGAGSLFATFGTLGSSAGLLSPGASALAAGLVLFAFASKAGLAPFHAWLPEAHPRAPSQVSALMSGAMLKVAIYGLLRYTSACWPTLPAAWGVVLLVLGLSGAVVAVIYANIARDLKRILAWSSVENIGLAFTMFGFQVLLRRGGWTALADLALAALFIHLLAHALFKTGLFLCAGAVIHGTRTGKIEMLGGLASRMPALSAGALVLALSAAALPPAGPFVAELVLLQSVMGTFSTHDAGAIAAAITVLVGVAFVSGLAVFAMVRLFAFTFLAEPRAEGARAAVEPPAALRLPVLTMAAGVVLLGVATPWFTPLVPIGIDVPSPPAVAGSMLADGSLPWLAPALAAAAVAACAVGWLLRRALGPATRIRRSHTWDCGQPIDSSMEYTATGFSAPVRFFLRDIVRAEKHVVFHPVVASNPWIKRGDMEFRKAGGVLAGMYFPIARLIEGTGAWLKQLQNGVIQFYIALILATLLLTLWVAL